jgi:predicted transcriptional regulator
MRLAARAVPVGQGPDRFAEDLDPFPAGHLADYIAGVPDGSGNDGRYTHAREGPAAAVPIKKSITQDLLICLEDGKKLKMLKRHLATRYSMTPEDYRRRWGLAETYPMVAPAYAAQRSALAKELLRRGSVDFSLQLLPGVQRQCVESGRSPVRFSGAPGKASGVIPSAS